MKRHLSAQAVKASRLVAALDRLMQDAGADPRSPVFSRAIARTMRSATSHDWWHLAEIAGTRPPSERVIARVIAVYYARSVEGVADAVRA
jgi:hypothetical protein